MRRFIEKEVQIVGLKFLTATTKTRRRLRNVVVVVVVVVVSTFSGKRFELQLIRSRSKRQQNIL